jgi:alpha-tubulin suppressor-like RCC1 family protein
LAVKTNGSLWSWGDNTDGQLGINSATSVAQSPVQVGTGTDWNKIFCGFYFNGAIKTDGSLYVWGRNTDGQLGDSTKTHRSSPVQVIGSYSSASAGYKHMAAMKPDYTLWMWGSNAYGQLGGLSTTHRSSPAQVIIGSTTWRSVVAFGDSTTSIKSDGAAYSWGRNTDGALGNIGVAIGTHVSSPMVVSSAGIKWSELSGGFRHVAALTLSSSNLMTSGSNFYGELGSDSRINRSISNFMQTVAGDVSWQELAVSGGGSKTNSSAAIKNDGTLWMWGQNVTGSLGTNDTNHRSSPVQTVAYGNTWSQVSISQALTTALKTDGSLWTWGNNQWGQLGKNDTTHRSSPVQVGTETNWLSVSAGENFALAIKTDNTLWSWGASFFGELGQNTNVHRSSPIQVGNNTNWSKISSGQYFSAAIKTDGTLWTWGNNGNGQLGNNTSSHRSSPVQVGTDATWASVDCGQGNAAAIKTDGTLWMWGANTSGQLGDNTIASRSSPVQTTAVGSDWKQVACASSNWTAALKTNGTLWYWGVQPNSPIKVSSPVQIYAGGKTWNKFQVGKSHVVGILDTTQPSPVVPTMFWPDPLNRASGYALDEKTLNASVLATAGGEVPGSIEYDPPKGTVLSVGTHTLTATSVLNEFYNEQSIQRTITIT